ncbi:TetR/AcrR family transcriptional regulator [Amorphoplanes nipponensis]|uniref:TetR family transcriptional regulator n=1 Tax=Actinoplanes nipponensis TaxID=135950 RepID=A0A919MJD0_9ACTN|nr:TetR/AcrR family transcriptional regulator [Actinoplanes nipponensis]GIE46522.1 TetR family transcriptional regulator [Actinoplanes nipponensis]
MTSTARAEQVRATRQKVLRAARDLFLRRGWSGATITAIAKRAAVSPQTVYNVVGGKAALLKAVWDVTLAGDDEPVPMIERPTARAMLDSGDPDECLRLYARMGRELAARAGPLIAVVFVQGAGRDPAVRAFVERIEGERAIGTAGVARHVARRFGLRDGLSEAEAGDVLWVLTAPELLDRFTRRRGWSLERYERWLADAMTDALLPRPEAAPRAGAPAARAGPPPAPGAAGRGIRRP